MSWVENEQTRYLTLAMPLLVLVCANLLAMVRSWCARRIRRREKFEDAEHRARVLAELEANTKLTREASERAAEAYREANQINQKLKNLGIEILAKSPDNRSS